MADDDTRTSAEKMVAAMSPAQVKALALMQILEGQKLLMLRLQGAAARACPPGSLEGATTDVEMEWLVMTTALEHRLLSVAGSEQ